MAEARATLILEVIRSDYQSVVDAAAASTLTLVDAQAQVIAQAPKVESAKKAEAAASKAQSDALKAVEKAYISALAPHEKTALTLEKTLALSFDHIKNDEERTRAISQQAVAVVHLSDKLDDQTRRFEANRGSQNKLSRSLAELLDEQTKAQTAAIAAGAALLKEGITADKVAVSIAHLKATTDAADRQSDAYKQGLASLEKQLSEVAAAEKAQTAAQKDAAEQYKKNADKLDSLKNAVEGLQLPGAQTIDAIKKLNDSLVKMNLEGNAAEAAMLKTGIAVGATVAVAAAAAAAVVGLSAAVVGVVSASDEWNDELDALGLKLDKVGTQKVNTAAASIDAIGSAAKLGGVSLATFFGPAVQEASVQIVALELAAIDAFNSLANGKKAVDLVAGAIARSLVEAVFIGVTALEKFSGVLEKWPGGGGLLAGVGKGIALLHDDIAELKDSAVDRLTESLAKQGEEGWVKLTANTKDYRAAAEELVKRQAALNDEMRAGAAAGDSYADALKHINEVQDRLNIAESMRIEALADMMGSESDAVQAFVDGYDLRIDIAEDLEASIIASIDRTTAKELKAIDQRKKAQQSAARATQSLLQSGADAAIGLINLVGGNTDKAARRSFLVAQAAAAGGAVVNTFLGITSALAEPVPMPLKVANAVAIGAAGAASVAGILAATFGGGGGASFAVPISGGGNGGTVGSSSSGGMPGSGQTSNLNYDQPTGKTALPGSGSGPTKGGGGDLPVTDAYIGMGMGGRSVRLAEGDRVVRGGALGASSLSDPRVLALLGEIAAGIQALLGTVQGGIETVGLRNHLAAVPGPARAR